MIINLTQHNASQEQRKENVFDLQEEHLTEVKSLLTINKGDNNLKERAARIAEIAKEYNVNKAMIGGAPFFMNILVQALKEKGIEPFFAFSERVAVEVDGVKKSIFKHAGWYNTKGEYFESI